MGKYNPQSLVTGTLRLQRSERYLTHNRKKGIRDIWYWDPGCAGMTVLPEGEGSKVFEPR
jgi:hypothetical protein